MRPLRRTLCLAALSASIVTTACIDDPTALLENPAPLTEAEAQLLGVQLWQKAFKTRLTVAADTAAANLESQSRALAISAEPLTFADSSTVTEGCQISGSIINKVALEGSIDPESGSAILEFEIVQTHDACREQVDGTTVTLSGAPNLTTAFAFSSQDDDFIILGAIEGAVAIFSSGRSSLCDVSVAFVGIELADGSSGYELDGQVCGHVVNESTQSEG